jgi:hypothetical protein
LIQQSSRREAVRKITAAALAATMLAARASASEWWRMNVNSHCEVAQYSPTEVYDMFLHAGHSPDLEEIAPGVVALHPDAGSANVYPFFSSEAGCEDYVARLKAQTDKQR